MDCSHYDDGFYGKSLPTVAELNCAFQNALLLHTQITVMEDMSQIVKSVKSVNQD